MSERNREPKGKPVPQKKEETLEVIQVPVQWHFPEHVESRYATNLLVQHGPHEFTISFFEAQPPILLTEDDRKRAATKIQSVRANCVARVVVSVERMPEFVEVLQKSLEQFRARFKKT